MYRFAITALAFWAIRRWFGPLADQFGSRRRVMHRRSIWPSSELAAIDRQAALVTAIIETGADRHA